MPRTGGVYTPPAGTKATANTTILSAPYNSFVDDLTADANAARPITAGGTGATSASAARTAIGADNASNLTTGTLANARLAGDYSFANLALSGGITTNGGIKTDTITTNTSQQVVINAGESADFATGQTAEQIYLNAETGTVITTSPDNWASGWAGRLTAVIKGDSITLAGKTVWHSGNGGAGSGLDADLLDGQHGAYYRDLGNSTGTLNNARLVGDYSFANLTLSGALQVSAAGGIIFANNDQLKFDDTTNTWSFNADGTPNSGWVQAGGFLNTGGDPAVHYNRVLTAGNGLAGGGDLSANRTFTLGTPSTITGSTTNAVTATSHTHDLSLTSANIIAFLGYTPVTTAREIVAGNGMSGGGTLGADRTIALGTPGTLTASTTNAVTTTSHTHDVDTAGIAAAGNAALAVGGIGTDAFLWNTVSETVNPGTTRAGSTLEYSNANGQTSGTSPAGTWRCMGYCFTGSGSPRSTLWRRIS